MHLDQVVAGAEGAVIPAAAATAAATATATAAATAAVDITSVVYDSRKVAPGALFTPDPTGTKEFGPINGSATKVGVINFAAPPILGDTSITPKVDLTGVYTQAAVLNNDFWFYYAWNRATTSGSGFMAVEFERAAKFQESPTLASTAGRLQSPIAHYSSGYDEMALAGLDSSGHVK